MSDKFQPVSMEALCAWVFGEWEAKRSIFGIPGELFFRPNPADPFRQSVYGQSLETPFGVAAGPHSQMAQNLVVAWLCGARFMELKTIQTLDELNVSKPCIDMQDVGYNVEWSQELKVHESHAEYLRAWVLIHALHKRLGFPGDAPGVIFNMSVGYDMKGILQPNVQSFLKMMANSSDRIHDYLGIVARHMPSAAELKIPGRLSDNVTLSTMHGCPPEEIGVISKYLMKDCGLHTNVKLNPTLLGPNRLRDILNNQLGYDDIEVPDAAFGHDLKYDDGMRLLHDLRATAKEARVEFGVKLSNTLEVVNRRKVFSPGEKMMYLSGRPLHALTVNLAAQLDQEFAGDLPMSFAGGADASNVASLLACGIRTITVCSDLLRSGGYTRMLQYLDNTRRAMGLVGAKDLSDYCCKTARRQFGFAASLCAEDTTKRVCPRLNLRDYSETVLREAAYRRDTYDRRRTKTARPLGPFDCIKAPCTDECPVNQKVPEYMTLVREGRWLEAARLTREDNPLPSILGRACNHLCEQVCVRTHYDEPLAIKDIKRAIMDHETQAELPAARPRRAEKVAVIGAGPCGLSVAYFLSLAGYPVELFESRPYAGGMVSGTIPGYRAAMDKVRYDMDLVLSLGAKVHYNCQAGRDVTLAKLRASGFAATVIAVGAQKVGKLNIDGEEGGDVHDALTFLRASREERASPLGRRVAVIGGGDVAMDCARTALRLGATGVQIIYRRTLAEMPASRDELRELMDEHIPVVELTAPKAIVREGGRLSMLRCVRMELGEPDASGRRRPVEVPGSEFEMPVDQVIVAVNQQPDLSFFDGEAPAVGSNGYLKINADLMTSLPDVYAGGDIGPGGPASIVKALGDGRAIARSIRKKFEKSAEPSVGLRHGMAALDRETRVDLARRRALRMDRVAIPQLDVNRRNNFEEVVKTMDDTTARREASRCLDCHKLCSYCVGVCPNLALFTYENRRAGAWSMPALKRQAAGWAIGEGATTVSIRQRYQVAVLTDFCNECGNCATFCPAAGRPYHDKPRLYVNRREFEAETDNAFRAVRGPGSITVLARIGGHTWRLRHEGARLELSAPGLVATLDAVSLQPAAMQTAGGGGPDALSLAPVPGLWVLLNALREDLAYIPVSEEA